MKRLLLLLVFLLWPMSVEARVKVQGIAQQGGAVIVTAGTPSTTKSIKSFPSCTVTVYLTGTTTLVSIYSDNAGTSKSNPFTAASDASWFFYVDAGRYDIRFSGTGITTPFTLSDIIATEATINSINVLDYGAKADAVIVEDASITASTATLTSLSSTFTTSDTGKTFCTTGAGAAGAIFCATGTFATATTITLASKASTTVSNARMVYGTNNTTLFQNALDGANSSTVAKRVDVPPGNFLFSSGSLSIAQGVRLQGSWEYAPDHMGYRYAIEAKPMSGKGTTLVVTSTEGTSTGRFILVNSEAALRGVSIFQPAQLSTLTSPKVYPWAVEMFGAGPTVENVELVNTYQGIYSHIGQRHTVRNVKGQPLLTGLYASQLLDTSLFANITFVPIYMWSTTETAPYTIVNLEQWRHQNGTAFKFGRVDNAVGENLFTYMAFVGFKFVVDASESTTFAGGTGAPGGKAWLQCNSCGADTVAYPVDIDDMQGADSTTAVGVTFVNPMFAAATWPGITFSPTPPLNAVYGRASNTGRLSLIGMRSNLAGKTVVWDGNGRLTISGSYFQAWTTNAITISTGTVSVTGSTFKQGSGTPVISVTGSPWVTFSGNLFEYTDTLTWSVSATTNHGEGGNGYATSPIWTAVSFQNSWVDFGGGFQAVSYKLQDGRVCLRGGAKSGTVGTGVPVFTLPAGHRPPAGLVFTVTSNNLFGIVQVAASGVVSVELGNNTSVFFDGICFAVR